MDTQNSTTAMQTPSTTEMYTVQDWNHDMAVSLIPIDVFLVMYIIVGMFGNSAVVYIYNVKQKVKMEDRYFILVLAGMDIIVCLTGPTFSLVRNVLPVNFRGDVLCRISWFFVRTMGTASGILLLIIAIQRYLKVCRPFGRQMTEKINKIALATCMIFAIIIDIPIFIFYGETKIYNKEKDVTGYRCGRRDGESSSLDEAILIYFYFMFGVALCVMSGVTFLYCLTGRTIYRQVKKHINLTSASYVASTSSTPASLHRGSNASLQSEKVCNSIKDKSNNLKQINDANIDRVIKSSPKWEKIKEDSMKSTPNSSPKSQRQDTDLDKKIVHQGSNLDLNSSHIGQRWKRNRLMAHRFSIMFMMIALVCTITYTPALIVNLFVNLDSTEFWTTYSDAERLVYLFLFQMYLLNHVVNPFIYAFFDKTFRKEVKHIFCCSNVSRKLQRAS